jgi:hypothetical protein
LAGRRRRGGVHGAASVAVTRYRFSDYRISTPWAPKPEPSPADQRPQHVESPVRWESHAGSAGELWKPTTGNP